MFEYLAVDKESGKVENQDQLMTGLQVYDNLFDLLFSLCEMLNMLKEKRSFDVGATSIIKDAIKVCENIFRDILKKYTAQDETKVPIIDKLIEKSVQHVKNILGGIEYQVYHQTLKEFSLAKEILSFLHTKDEQHTALSKGFNDIFYLQLYFQTVMRNKDRYAYVDHLMPSASTIFRRGEITSLAYCFQAGVINVKILKNCGGFSDVFDFDVKMVFNSAICMCSLLIDVQNQSKIFFEEIKIKTEVCGLLDCNSQTDIIVDNFAANSTRKFKICFKKIDFTPVRIDIKIWCQKLITLTSENSNAHLTKLESMAAIRDIFEKKSLSCVKDLRLAAFNFALPLNFAHLPTQTIRTIEERQLFSSLVLESTSDSPSIMDLSRYNKNPRLRHFLLVIDTAGKPIYVKDNPGDQFTKLQQIAGLKDKGLSCYLMTPFATPDGSQFTIVDRFEKQVDQAAVSRHVYVKSDVKSVCDSWCGDDWSDVGLME